MLNLLKKELTLASMPISYLFILFSAMIFIPNYPILVGGFFVCMGIFYSFQHARECSDILYSALLPVAKRDVVRGKFLFVLFIEGIAFLLSIPFVVLRMTVLAEAPVYAQNTLMNGNVAYLGYLLMLFALFNSIFLGGFFKNAHSIGIPFLLFAISALLLIGSGETLHFLPGLEELNACNCSGLWAQTAILLLGILLFAAATLISLKISEKRFEALDL